MLLAPPGYGKSTLLRELITHHAGAHLIGLHPELLELSRLQAALEAADPTALILVDDIHHLESAPELGAWFCTHIAQDTDRAWVLAGRHLPQSFETHIAQFSTLTTKDLEFTPAESAHLIDVDTATRDAKGESTQDWHEATTGWPLAIGLLQATGHRMPPPLLASLPTSHASDAKVSQQQSQADSKSRTAPTHNATATADLTSIPSAYQPILGLIQQLLDGMPAQQARFLCVAALPTQCHPHLLSAMLEITRQDAAAHLAELARRNLFLTAQTTPGWYRIHDLVRDCLHAEAYRRLGPAAVTAWFRTAAIWFARQHDIPAAIDHALLGGDFNLAVKLLEQLPPTFIIDQGYFRTYQRWIEALPHAVQAQHPNFLIQLGRSRLEIGDRRGARTWLSQALNDAHAQNDREHLWLAQTALAKLCNIEGDLDQAVILSRAVIESAPTTDPAHLQALNALGNTYTHLNRFRQARTCFETALHLLTTSATDASPAAMDEADMRMQANLRHNLAMGIHIPSGQFEAAQAHLQVNDRYYASRPVARSLHYLAWSALHEATGDWARLWQDLAEIEAAEAEAEQSDEENNWYYWFKAIYYIGMGDYREAAALLDTVTPMMIADEDILCLAYTRIWLLRRRGDHDQAAALAQSTLAESKVGPYYRGMIALEWLLCLYPTDMAVGAVDEITISLNTAGEEAPADPAHSDHRPYTDPLPNSGQLLHSPIPIPAPIERELPGLLQARAQPWLLRLRAWLAYWEARINHPTQQRETFRTRHARHMRRILAQTEQKFYWQLLIHREPELGLGIWLTCLEMDNAAERAIDALLELANSHNGLPGGRVVKEVLDRIDHPNPILRANIASLLMRLGDEQALPALIAQQAKENHPQAKAAMNQAIDALEAAPPPRLHITLMGDFSVVRGDRLLTDSDWHRPAVRRLFQYFALHMGEILSRERILDDLWPDTPPDAARNTFRTLFSWLRRALDPHLRPKSPARYFRVTGEVYCFAPMELGDRITSDWDRFEVVVQSALAHQEPTDLPHLPEELLTVLNRWSPLLPELPYEPWAVITRERSVNLYAEGCLHAAQKLLHLLRPAEAAHWARRTIEVSPWLEEAYQLLMQAQARQGRRTQALRTYAEATEALRAELDVTPTALTDWLAHRLRQGEEI